MAVPAPWKLGTLGKGDHFAAIEDEGIRGDIGIRHAQQLDDRAFEPFAVCRVVRLGNLAAHAVTDTEARRYRLPIDGTIE